MDAHGSARARRVDKFGQRREALVGFALETLMEQGYCRTSLRDIAERSSYSHGVVHYYFADKLDLMSQCLDHYRQRAESQLGWVIEHVGPSSALAAEVGQDVASQVSREWEVHRLWYDLRTQAMYEDRLRESVSAVEQARQELAERLVRHYGTLTGREVPADGLAAYALIDGLVAAAVMRHSRGVEDAEEWLASALSDLFPRLVEPEPA